MLSIFNDLFVFQRLEKQRRRCYEELRERIERESKLQKVTEELELQKHLMVWDTTKKHFFRKPSEQKHPQAFSFENSRRKLIAQGSFQA